MLNITMKKFFVMLLSALGICVGCSANDGIEVLTPQQFNDMVQSDSLATVLDVRRPEEYANGHLKNAILINWLDAPAFDKGIEKLDKTRHYYIYCRSGRRSHDAALKMKSLGFTVYDLKGGILNWGKEDMPITH